MAYVPKKRSAALPAGIPAILASTVIYHKDAVLRLATRNHELFFMPSGLVRGTVVRDGIMLFSSSGEPLRPRMLLVPPGSEVDFAFRGEWTEFVSISFVFPDLLFDRQEGRISLRIRHRAFPLPFFLDLSASEVDRIRPIVFFISETLRNNPREPALRAAAFKLPYLLSLFIPAAGEAPRSRAEQLHDLIENDPGEKRSFFNMSEALGVRWPALRRAFKAKYGATPQRYRAERRYQAVLHYLRDTDLPTREICAALGMRSAAHLSIFLKRFSGESVSSVRAGGRATRKKRAR